MQKVRTIVLVGVLCVLAVVYLWAFVFAGEPEPLRVMYNLYQPTRFNPGQPVYGVTFTFPKATSFRLVDVTEVEDPTVEAAQPGDVETPAAGAQPALPQHEQRGDIAYTLELDEQMQRQAEEAGGPMWRLVPGDGEQRGVFQLRYGQTVDGMVADPDRSARDLQAGKAYRLRVVDKDGREGQLVFQTSYFQKPMTNQEYQKQFVEQARRRLLERRRPQQ